MEAGSESNVKKFDKNALLMVLFVASALIVGVFIGVFLPREPVPLVALGGTQGTCPDLNAAAGTCATPITAVSEAEVKTKVQNFLENSDTIFFETASLKDNGYGVEITAIEDLLPDFYTVSFNITKAGAVVQPSKVYVSRDAEKVIFGNAMDLKAPIAYTAPPAPELPKTGKPNVKMFVMSFCPYGKQAESGLQPVAELLGDKIEFEPHFVIYSNYSSGYPNYCIDKDSKYCSMHGVTEVNEDVRQMCIWKYDKAKFWPYISKVNATCTVNDIETCWKTQAQAVGIDTAKIETCFKDEATTLLEAEAALNAQYSVQGSPMVFVNGTEYSGGRAAENYKQGICGAFDTQPADCNNALGATAGAASGSC
jgi:glutaredoxin